VFDYHKYVEKLEGHGDRDAEIAGHHHPGMVRNE
jgi:hypothetical protein